MTPAREPHGAHHHVTPASPPGVPAPGPLALERYLARIPAATRALATAAEAAGTDAPVPTCPRWTVADLVAHQGLVHRWATSHLTGHGGRAPDGGALPTKAGYLRAVPRAELTAW